MKALAWITVALLAFAGLGRAADPPLAKWDFETGDLQGWKVVKGRLGPQPSDNDNDRHGGNFGKQGRYFIGTFEGAGDKATGEIRSPVFTVRANKLALRIGGGAHVGTTYVALCRAEDDHELIAETGHNAERMDLRIWDVSAYKGRQVYLKVVDQHSGGWGHINLDDIRELTAAEEREIERREARRKAEMARRLRQWKRDLHRPAPRTVYHGATARHVALPLGGIGAGSIALTGQGALEQWQIMNTINSRAYLPGSFLSVWAQVGGREPVARVLQLKPIGDLPLVRDLEFVGEYPWAFVTYRDPALRPLRISLEAFSPLIPLNAPDSALPAVIFVLKVRNEGSRTARVSVAQTVQNGVGWDGRTPINGTKLSDPSRAEYGGNFNEVRKLPGMTSIQMAGARLKPNHKRYGTMTLSALTSNATTLAQWNDAGMLWADFAADGQLDGPMPVGLSPSGETWNAALAVPLTVEPGQERRAVFVLTWHFPNHYADYQKELAQFRIGNMYNNWFRDSYEVAGYVQAQFQRLYDQTELFRATFYDSTLPYWFLDCISSQISTIRTQTCMWIEDGTVACFEGAGCCPMNCTHVWNYEQTLAHMWPSLERNMRETDYFVQQMDSGAIRHRTRLPLSQPRWTGPACDGHLSTIVKTYREYLRSADQTWLDKVWPRCRRAMDWAITEYDPDGNGVLEGQQFNTYDCSVYGPNTFIGTQWLAALRAKYRQLFTAGRQKYDDQLWNGEYWIQKYDEDKIKKHQYGRGCHSDQLMGQWWADILGLGDVLPADHIQTALQSIMKYSWLPDFTDFVHHQRVFADGTDKGLLCCTWPHGGRPAQPILYCDEVWTGLEYEVAAQMIYRGMIDEAYCIVKGARDRYNGVKRNPWDEIECGEHYARAMSSWSLLLAAEGFQYNGPRGVMSFAPHITPENFRAFFSAAEGWGTFSQRRRGRRLEVSLEVAHGRVRLAQFSVALPAGTTARAVAVRLGSHEIEPVAAVVDGQLVLDFGPAVTVGPGQGLAATVISYQRSANGSRRSGLNNELSTAGRAGTRP